VAAILHRTFKTVTVAIDIKAFAINLAVAADIVVIVGRCTVAVVGRCTGLGRSCLLRSVGYCMHQVLVVDIHQTIVAVVSHNLDSYHDWRKLMDLNSPDSHCSMYSRSNFVQLSKKSQVVTENY